MNIEKPVSRLIAIVPARAGSVRVPMKNTKCVGGVSLVERAVQHARAAAADLIVVTTDDADVKQLLAGQSAVTIIDRPPHLATSQASTDDVVRHVIESLPIEPEATVLILQPTSPFRSRALLTACKFSVSQHPDAATISVVRTAKVAGWARCMASDGMLEEMPVTCDPVMPSGAVYAFRCGSFLTHGSLASMSKFGVVCPLVHACDIDEEYELVIAAALADAGYGDDVIDLGTDGVPLSSE
jgi:N-acylneuraminate cytidylyltransferase